MTEQRLSSQTITFSTVAPQPEGILNDLAGNGIVTAGMTPQQVANRVQMDGEAIVRFCSTFNEPSLASGSLPYSELRIEDQLAELAKRDRRSVELAERNTLVTKARSNSNPTAALAAEDTLLDAEGIDPNLRSIYYENQLKIEQLESHGKKNLTKPQKNALRMLRGKQRQIRRRHSEQVVFGRTRQFFRSRADIRSRQGSLGGSSEEEKAATLEGRGQVKPIRQYLGSKERRRRATAETEQTRNIVSRKGTILTYNGRRHVVADCISTPAQAHKVKTVINGKPVFEVGARTREPILYPMYRAKIDPSTGKPLRDPATRKIQLEKEPMPRDGSYRSGLDKNTGKSTVGEQFYYADGTPIHIEAWGPDSFSPIDDMVILKPLLTGAEAFEIIVRGAKLIGIDLRDVGVMVKELTSLVENNPMLIETEKERNRLLQNLLVFSKSDSTTPSGARTKRDQARGAGHFRRFDYVDPASSRERTIANYIEKYAGERIRDSHKKGKKARSKRLG